MKYLQILHGIITVARVVDRLIDIHDAKKAARKRAALKAWKPGTEPQRG